MARHVVKLLIGFIVLLFSSCGEWGVYIDVIEGNYAFSRGDYMAANFDYLQALRSGRDLPRISYNLGNVYHALEESEAAIEEWKKAEEAEDTELLHKIAFNRGVLFYEQGAYKEAYRYFRRALKFQPEDVEAKINLEYALRKQTSEEGTGGEAKENGQKEEEVSGDAKRILDYVKRDAPTKLVPQSAKEKKKEVKNW